MKIVISFLLVVIAIPAFAQRAKVPMYMQLTAGDLKLSDNSLSLDYEDTDYNGRLETLPYLGGNAQVIVQDGTFGYGWEAGAFVSWKNDNVIYSAQSGPGGTTVNISFDNQYLAFETFMGLYADLTPTDFLRFYVSAGPLILMGRADREDTDQVQPLNSTIVVDVKSHDTDISTGFYARLGAEFRISGNYWAGLNIRYMDSELNLSKSLGNFKIDGYSYLLCVSLRY